jgi:hypothetical protein
MVLQRYVMDRPQHCATLHPDSPRYQTSQKEDVLYEARLVTYDQGRGNQAVEGKIIKVFCRTNWITNSFPIPKEGWPSKNVRQFQGSEDDMQRMISPFHI